MDRERDEDTFKALKEMAEDIHLGSRNYNDELIGIDYYANLSVLTDQQLAELRTLWHDKCVTCQKEKLASQWMLIQMLLFVILTAYVSWLTGDVTGIISGFISVMAMMFIIEDKRVFKAKKNLQDARRVYQHLVEFKNVAISREIKKMVLADA